MPDHFETLWIKELKSFNLYVLTVNSHTHIVIASLASAQYMQQFTQVDSTLFWNIALWAIIFFPLFKSSLIFISYAKISYPMIFDKEIAVSVCFSKIVKSRLLCFVDLNIFQP